MGRTTIEIDDDTRDRLRDARKPHESNYDDTLRRLLGQSSGGQLWTEAEIRDLCRDEIRDARR